MGNSAHGEAVSWLWLWCYCCAVARPLAEPVEIAPRVRTNTTWPRKSDEVPDTHHHFGCDRRVGRFRHARADSSRSHYRHHIRFGFAGTFLGCGQARSKRSESCSTRSRSGSGALRTLNSPTRQRRRGAVHPRFDRQQRQPPHPFRTGELGTGASSCDQPGGSGSLNLALVNRRRPSSRCAGSESRSSRRRLESRVAGTEISQSSRPDCPGELICAGIW